MVKEMKLKRIQVVDAWSSKEQLCLASAVLRSGDQNWMSVSRSLKPFGDSGRPADWYSQKNCAVQYSSLLENVETPKRKKRNEKGDAHVETPGEAIVRKLTQERIDELKRLMQEGRVDYNKLKDDILQVRTGYVDDRLDDLCQQIEEEKQLAEKEIEAHFQWLKEREKKLELERAWKPPVVPPMPHRRKVQRSMNRRNSSQSDPSSEADSTLDSPLSESLNVDIINEEHSDIQPEQKHPPQTPTSPLLTSLLKSPSPAPPPQGSSILHSAITSNRGSSPTITSLLNSAPGIPVSSSSVTVAPPTTVSSSLKNLVSSAISSAPTEHPQAHIASPAAGAPTLSMLLELPPSLPGKPLPELPSAAKPITTPPSTIVNVSAAEVCHPQHQEFRMQREMGTDEHVEVVEVEVGRQTQSKEEPIEVLIEEVVMNDGAVIASELLTNTQVSSDLPEQEDVKVNPADADAKITAEKQNINEIQARQSQALEIPSESLQEHDVKVSEAGSCLSAVTNNETEALLFSNLDREKNEKYTEVVVEDNVDEIGELVEGSRTMEVVSTGETELTSGAVAEVVEIAAEEDSEETIQTEVVEQCEPGIQELAEMEVIILEKIQGLVGKDAEDSILHVTMDDDDGRGVQQDENMEERNVVGEAEDNSKVEEEMLENTNKSVVLTEEKAVEETDTLARNSPEVLSVEVSKETESEINVIEKTVIEDVLNTYISQVDEHKNDNMKTILLKENLKTSSNMSYSGIVKASVPQETTLINNKDVVTVTDIQNEREVEKAEIVKALPTTSDIDHDLSAEKQVLLEETFGQDTHLKEHSENIDAKECLDTDLVASTSTTEEAIAEDDIKKDMLKELPKEDASVKGGSSKKDNFIKESSKKDDILKEKTKKYPAVKEDSHTQDDVDHEVDKKGTIKPVPKKGIPSKESHKRETKADSYKKDANAKGENHKKITKEDSCKKVDEAKETNTKQNSKEILKDVFRKEASKKECLKEIPLEVPSRENSKKETPLQDAVNTDNSRTEVAKMQYSMKDMRRKEIMMKEGSKESKRDWRKEIREEVSTREAFRRTVSKEENNDVNEEAKKLHVKEISKKEQVNKLQESEKKTTEPNKTDSDNPVNDEQSENVFEDKKEAVKRSGQEEVKTEVSEVKKRVVESHESEAPNKASPNFSANVVTKVESEEEENKAVLVETVNEETKQSLRNLDSTKQQTASESVDEKPEKHTLLRADTPSTEDDKTNDAEPPRNTGRRRLGACTPSDSVPSSPASTTDEEREYRAWKKAIMLVYGRLATHKFASLFLRPITDDQAPGYSSIVHRPIDLLMIKKNIETGVTRTTAEFQRDVMLMFQNSIMYNKSTHFVHKMACQMQEEGMQHIQDFLTTQMLVQSVGEVPLRRETRTTEANKHRDLLGGTTIANQDDGDSSHNTKRKRGHGSDLERTNKKKKVED